MSARVLALGVALACSVAVFAKEKTEATATTSNNAVSLQATAYVDKDSVTRLVGSDLSGYYTVLQVTVTPKSGKLTVDPDDFLLRTDRDGERTQPMAPSQIAGHSDMTVKEVRTGTGSVGTQPTGPVWGNVTLPTGQAAGNGVTSSSTLKGTMNKSPAGKDDPMLAVLKGKVLSYKESDQPVSGLLIFNLERQKLKDLELIYSTPAGPLKLRFR